MANISRSYSNGSAIKVEYSYTQNVSKNQSTITMTLYVHRDSYGPSWNTHCNSYIRLDGSNVMTYTGSFNISTSWVKIGSTVTKTVNHNADGTKSISITGFFDSQGLTSKLDDLSCSGTVTLKTIPRASSISSITGDTIGETVTIRLNRASSSFTHRLYYTFGDTKNRLLSSSVATSYSFKPSMNDCAYLPNGTSGTATIRADTYNGSTKIGSASKNFTLKVPSSVVPTLSGVSVTRVDGDVPEDWGVYVKGKSSAKVQINGAAGAYGSTIKDYAISGGDYSGTANPFTTGILNTAGEVTFTGKITDSRGRTASGSASITVEDYAPPVLTSVEAHRCSASGELQDDGEYITLTAVFSGSTVGGRNAITGKYRRMPEGGDWTSLSSLTSGQAVVFPASGDSTFSVEVQVSDAFTTISQAVIVNSVEFIMDFKAGGNGIAFGKAAEYDDLLDVQWDARFRGNVRIEGDAQFDSGLTFPPWQAITLAPGVTPGKYGTRSTPSYRKIGNHVFVEGGVTFTISGTSSVLLGTLPVGYRPMNNKYVLVACSGYRVARLYVAANGNIYCEWIFQLDSNSRYTGEMAWMQIDIEYFIDETPEGGT